MVFKALTDLVNYAPKKAEKTLAVDPRQTQQLSRFPNESAQRSGGRGSVQFLDPRQSTKASQMDIFSQNALTFINSASNNTSSPYTEQQLLAAYMTSVYVYAAVSRIANLISRVKIVGEAKYNDKWVRLEETHRLNQLFDENRREVLPRMWLNEAVYGGTLVYKVKTRRAILDEEAGRPIYDFKDGAVAGLYVIDRPMWDLDEDITYGAIRGFYVNQYHAGDTLLGNRNYLKRKEGIYTTSWNPMNPNRGKAKVAICIHEAVANASIAQWISEYFTRGAMPFIMVSLAEDDPNTMTDSDFRKYKRQFEDNYQGMGASLRTSFFDRKVDVQQVGISADEVAAPDLNTTALEGIAATFGLDRELIVTPEGGSQDRHALLIKRAWEDTVIPLVEKYVAAFNKDLGLPDNLRVAVDLSEISELDADRQDIADTELSVYQGQLQSYNEARTRLKMPPIPELDGWYSDGNSGIAPLERILEVGEVPAETLQKYAMDLWENNLAKRSEVLTILNRTMPEYEIDGYKYEIEGKIDLIQGMWDSDLLTRSQVLRFLKFPMPTQEFDDGYHSEIERGKDYGNWITDLWDKNLLTRGQALEMLEVGGLGLPEGSPDGYTDEIGSKRSNIMDMWDKNLLTRDQALEQLSVLKPDNMVDGYVDEIQNYLDEKKQANKDLLQNVSDWWGNNLLTRSQTLQMLNVPIPEKMVDGYVDEIGNTLEAEANKQKDLTDLWKNEVITRSYIVKQLGLESPENAYEGYSKQAEIVDEAQANQDAAKYSSTDDGGGGGSGGGGFGGSRFRSIQPIESTPGSDAVASEIDGIEDWMIADNGDNSNLIADTRIDEDIAGAGAEEDYLEDFGDYPNQVLTPFYNGEIDIIPDQVLPHADTPDLPETELDQPEFDFETPGAFVSPGHYYENNSTASLAAQMKSRIQSYFDSMKGDVRASVAEQSASKRIGIRPAVRRQIPPNVEMVDYAAPMTDDLDLVDYDLVPANEPYTLVYNDEDADDVYDLYSPIETQEFEIVDFGVEIEEPIAPVQAENQEKNLYVSLQVGANEELVQLQDQVRELLGNNPDITWDDPVNFHVTLVFAPDASDEDMQKVLQILPSNVPNMMLRLVAVNTFSNDDSTVIKCEVDRSDMLMQLQGRLTMAFNSFGIRLSAYSDPAEYNPHITLGYAPAGTHVPNIPLDIQLKAETVNLGRDGYVMVAEIPVVSADPAERALRTKAQQKDARNELKAWERATMKNGVSKGIRFETVHLDGQLVQTVKTQLSQLKDKRDVLAIRGIFVDTAQLLAKQQGSGE